MAPEQFLGALARLRAVDRSVRARLPRVDPRGRAAAVPAPELGWRPATPTSRRSRRRSCRAGPVPSGLEAWLARLLEKDPARRFQCAADATWGLEQLDPDDVGRRRSRVRSVEPRRPRSCTRIDPARCGSAAAAGLPPAPRSSAVGRNDAPPPPARGLARDRAAPAPATSAARASACSARARSRRSVARRSATRCGAALRRGPPGAARALRRPRGPDRDRQDPPRALARPAGARGRGRDRAVRRARRARGPGGLAGMLRAHLGTDGLDPERRSTRVAEAARSHGTADASDQRVLAGIVLEEPVAARGRRDRPSASRRCPATCARVGARRAGGGGGRRRPPRHRRAAVRPLAAPPARGRAHAGAVRARRAGRGARAAPAGPRSGGRDRAEIDGRGPDPRRPAAGRGPAPADPRAGRASRASSPGGSRPAPAGTRRSRCRSSRTGSPAGSWCAPGAASGSATAPTPALPDDLHALWASHLEHALRGVTPEPVWQALELAAVLGMRVEAGEWYRIARPRRPGRVASTRWRR